MSNYMSHEDRVNECKEYNKLAASTTSLSKNDSDIEVETASTEEIDDQSGADDCVPLYNVKLCLDCILEIAKESRAIMLNKRHNYKGV